MGVFLRRAKKKVIDSHVEKLTQRPAIRPFDDDMLGGLTPGPVDLTDEKAVKRCRREQRELLESWWREYKSIKRETVMLDRGEVKELRKLAKGKA
jgi:hypothetical protein